MPDDKFELPMQPGLEDRSEQQDAETLQQELEEQSRIAGETGGVFDKNRVPSPGIGQGGRIVRNRDHWGQK